MAEENNQGGGNPSLYSDNVTTFAKGINKDMPPGGQPEGTYRFALNAVNEDQLGNYGFLMNEAGNYQCIDMRDGSWQPIGSIYLEDDSIIVFLAPSDISLLGFGTGVGYGRIIRVYKDCKHEVLLTSDCLNFKVQHQVQGEFRVRNGCEHVLYFTDNFNPPRSINIDSLSDYLSLGNETYISDNPGGEWRFASGIWDCDKFKLFPDFEVPNVEFISLTEGGQLLAGMYYFTYQYLDQDGNTTNWIDITQPIPVYKDPLSNGALNIKGDAPNTCTNKAITIQFTNLDQSFKFLRVAYTRAVNGTGTADLRFITAGEFQITSPTEEFVLSQDFSFNEGGVEGEVEISYNEILSPKQNYIKAKTIAQLENRLVLGNVQSESIDYAAFQQAANNIQLRYTTRALSSDDPEDDSPQSGKYYFDYRSFMRDEVYAFGIVWIFNDGSPSPVFHIPGRAKDLMSDGTACPVVDPNNHSRPLNSPNGWDSQLIDPTVDSLNTQHLGTEFADANGMFERWQVYNTAIRTSVNMDLTNRQVTEGEMGYFEAARGEYPNVLDCEGNRVYPEGNVRHHRMPDTTLEPHVLGSNVVPGGEISTNVPNTDGMPGVFWDNQNPHADNISKVVTLGVIGYNIAPPAGMEGRVQGFKIVKARKKPSDQSILDKGLTYYNQLFTKTFYGENNDRSTPPDDCHHLQQSNNFNRHLDSSNCVHDTRSEFQDGDGNWYVGRATDDEWGSTDYIPFNAWGVESSTCIDCGEGTGDKGKTYNAPISWLSQIWPRNDQNTFFAPGTELAWQGCRDGSGGTPNQRHRLMGYPMHGNWDTGGDTTNVAGFLSNWLNIFNNNGVQWEVGQDFPYYPKPLASISYHGPGTKFNTGASGCEAATTGTTSTGTSLPSSPTYMKYESVISGYQSVIIYNDACCRNNTTCCSSDENRNNGDYDGHKTYNYHKMTYHNSYVPYRDISAQIGAFYPTPNSGHQPTNWSGQNNGGAISPNCNYPLYNVSIRDSYKVDANARVSIDSFEDIFENRYQQETFVINTDSPNGITGNFEIPYPNGPADNSYSWGAYSRTGAHFRNKIGTAYYVSLKKPAENAYGAIGYLQYYNTHNGIIRWTNAALTQNSGQVFGGDSFISRFAFKQTQLNQRCANSIYNGAEGGVFDSCSSNIAGGEWSPYPADAVDADTREGCWNTGTERQREAAFKHIVWYWVESYINTELRNGYDEAGKRFYPYYYEGSAFYGPVSFVDPEYDHDDGGSFHNPATTDDGGELNFYEYNADYSAINNLKPYFSLNITFDFCNDCHENFPQRVAYSRNSFKEEQQDMMKDFLANSYADLPGNRGEITNIFTVAKRLYIHMNESLWAVDPSYTAMNADDSNIYLGTGEFLANPPQEMLQSSTGYLGSESQWATITTENGTFFVDARHGRVILQAGTQPKDIGAIGMRNWFEENMQINIYTQYMNMFSNYGDGTGNTTLGSLSAENALVEFPHKDNPANPAGAGFLATYDARHNRYILTKRDYKILPPYDTNGQLTLNEITGQWQINDGTTQCNCPDIVYEDGTTWVQDPNNPDQCIHEWQVQVTETINNKKNIYLFYDTTSLGEDYATAVYNAFEQWKSIQQGTLPDGSPGILADWVGEVYHIPVGTITGSPQLGGKNDCERWVQWASYGYLGNACFSNTTSTNQTPRPDIDYYAGFTGNIPTIVGGDKNYLNIIIADEAVSSYHPNAGSSVAPFLTGTASDFAGEPTPEYINDWKQHVDTIQAVTNAGGDIKTLLYPVAHSTNGQNAAARAVFVLHALAAIEGEILTNLSNASGNAAQVGVTTNPNPLPGANGIGQINLDAILTTNPYLTTNFYSTHPSYLALGSLGVGLKNYGVEARYDKRKTSDFDVDSQGNSVFGDDLTSYLAGQTNTTTIEYEETTPCLYDPVYIENKSIFEDLSWTVSFSVTFGSWTSFHSYTPNLYVHSKNHFFTAINTENPTYDSTSRWLWKHGINSNHDNYQTFYGVTYPHILELINNGNGMQVTTYNNIHFITDAYLWDSTNNYYVEDRYTTFDSGYLYNDYQISGILSFVSKDTDIENMPIRSIQNITGQSLLTRKERVWAFNEFRDLAVNRDTNSRLSMFTSEWSDPNYQGYYGGNNGYIDKVINTNSISTTKEWYEQQRFRDKYLGIRLFFSNLANTGKNKLITNFLYGSDTYTVR
tara:strand:+ start:7919 stop:14458 length:6540 start_codon:yes stop_codon:yes gene_type:complete